MLRFASAQRSALRRLRALRLVLRTLL